MEKLITSLEKISTNYAAAEAKARKTADTATMKAANEFFENGGTLDEFAEAYGKSTVTTRNKLRELGVDVPLAKRGAKSKFSDDQKAEIAAEWFHADKRGRLTLALDKDVTEATMRTWAIEFGVYTPVKRSTTAEQSQEVAA